MKKPTRKETEQRRRRKSDMYDSPIYGVLPKKILIPMDELPVFGKHIRYTGKLTPLTACKQAGRALL